MNNQERQAVRLIVKNLEYVMKLLGEHEIQDEIQDEIHGLHNQLCELIGTNTVLEQIGKIIEDHEGAECTMYGWRVTDGATNLQEAESGGQIVVEYGVCLVSESDLHLSVDSALKTANLSGVEDDIAFTVAVEDAGTVSDVYQVLP